MKVEKPQRSLGLTAMGVFLFFGASLATLAGVTLAFPGTLLDPLWKLSPEAGEGLRQLGRGIAIPFLGLGVAMVAAGVGWVKRRQWGWSLAMLIVASQVAGDLVNAMRGQFWKGAIGVVIAGALLVYLLQQGVRSAFVRSDT